MRLVWAHSSTNVDCAHDFVDLFSLFLGDLFIVSEECPHLLQIAEQILEDLVSSLRIQYRMELKLDVVGKVKRHLLVLPRVLKYPTLLLELLVTFLLDVLELLLERLGLRLLQLPDSLKFFREPPCSIDCELLARLDALVEDNEQTLHHAVIHVGLHEVASVGLLFVLLEFEKVIRHCVLLHVGSSQTGPGPDGGLLVVENVLLRDHNTMLSFLDGPSERLHGSIFLRRAQRDQFILRVLLSLVGHRLRSAFGPPD